MTRAIERIESTERTECIKGGQAEVCSEMHGYAPRWLALLAIVGSMALSGCSEMLPELVPFGSVSSPDQYRSINGLGIHRKMWESAGVKVLTPQKLSPKLNSFETIVLVGQTFEPPGIEAREWLERWLAADSGRTLIYFGRDFNADVYYRERTLARVPADDQPRAEHLLALAKATELGKRLSELPESTFAGWFFLDVEQPPQMCTDFTGEWGEQLSGLDGQWPTRVLLQPPRKSFKNRLPSWLQPGAATPPKRNTIPNPFQGSEVVRSTWRYDELDTKEAWDEAFTELPRSETLVADAAGQALLFRLTDSSKYQGSQILVVTNGAPLLNGSLVEPLHQRIGELLIAEALPAERVALLTYSSMGLLISDIPESDARGAGLEMLMLWPLSAITIPAALLGVIVCAVLLPILGRPQSLPRRSVSDFGLHVEALGAMLQQTRDSEFAKTAVRNYFQRVRGETPPAWLEEVVTATVQTPSTEDQVKKPDGIISDDKSAQDQMPQDQSPPDKMP